MYSMQVFRFPYQISLLLDKINCGFLWGSTGGARRPHDIRWSIVYQRKEAGGLGIRRMDLQNRAFLMKNAWRFFTVEDSVWVRILWAKYWTNRDGSVACGYPGKIRFWCSIVSVWNDMLRGFGG